MNAVFLGLIYIFSATQAICIKRYNGKVLNRGLYTWTAMLSFSAVLFFIAAAGGKIAFEPALFIYSGAFAVFYALATLTKVAALRYGPLSLTDLISAYSLMIPTAYGVAFLQEPTTIWLIFGLILLGLSLLLIHYKKAERGITKKWALLAFLCFIGNGMCSTTQKIQQLKFNGTYKNEFMIYALVAITVFSLILAVLTNKKEVFKNAKKGWHLAFLCGAANGVVNLFVMVLGGLMPVSIMFPLISAGNIIFSYLISRFIYKEHLSKRQLMGVAFGVVSIVFFNL